VQANWKLPLRLEHRFQDIIAAQERRGVAFDKAKAEEYVAFLQKEMDKAEEQVRPFLPPIPKPDGKAIEKPWKKNGELIKRIIEWREGEDIAGPFCKVEWQEIELSQREKLAQTLQNLGWSPSSYTDKGNAQLTPNKEPCPNLKAIPGFPGESLASYFILSHRKSQIEGWIKNVRPDGRITAACNPCGTNTARVRHKIVTNVPKAGKEPYPNGSPVFGKEMRSLFTVSEGRVLIGGDADGLQARLLAHYMNDDHFTQELLEGDIHTKMLDSCQPTVADRPLMKNCVPLDTKALTKEGWKDYYQIQEGDLVLSYNPETEKKEWTPVLKKHYFKDREVVNVTNTKGFSFRSTPDHRWYVKKRRWDSKKGRWDTSHPYMKIAVETTEELNTESNIIVNAPMSEDNISLEKNWNLDTEKYGHDWTETVCNMDSSERRAFLAGFLIADGSKKPDKNWQFNQKDNEHFDAALTASFIEFDGQCHVTKHSGKGMKSVRVGRKGHVTGQKLEKHHVGYEDVWCVTTKNGTWVARQDDTITITGNCFYGYIFGAGQWKLGVTAGYSGNKAKDAGSKIDKGIRWALPALADLNDRVKSASKRGYLIGLDGRKLWMRKDPSGKIMEHKALNTLIQGAESIIMKTAACYTDRQIKKRGLDAQQVMFVHDEIQIDSDESCKEEVKDILSKSFEWTADYFNMRVLLTGKAIAGQDWSETH